MMTFHGSCSCFSSTCPQGPNKYSNDSIWHFYLFHFPGGEEYRMWIDIHTILQYMDCVHVLSTLRKSIPNFMTPNTERYSVENRNLVGMID